MQVFNEKIEREKFNDWHLILCQTNGRYVREPIILEKSVIVYGTVYHGKKILT